MKNFPFTRQEVVIFIFALIGAAILIGVAMSQPPSTWAQGVDGRP
jgi:hypothetical protein